MRAPLIPTIALTAMVLLGASVAALGAPYDMPGLSEPQTAAPPQWSPGGPMPYGPPCDNGQCDGGQCDEGLFARLFDPCGGPRWKFSGDALALQRSGNRGQPLLTTLEDPLTVLNASNLDVPVTIGFQTSAIRHGVFGTEFDIEVGYFQIDWALNTGVTDTVGLVTDVNGANFNVVNPAIHYAAGLHLGEINLRQEWCDGVTLLAGFRMGELDERYTVNASGIVPGTMVTLDTRTFNHLYGFQVGADADLFEENGPLHLHVLCKAGVYGNAAAQRNHQMDPQDEINQTVAATQNQTAFMGELGLTLCYEMNCHLSFRVTGSAVWLECVALAPDQLGTSDFNTNNATVDTHGQVFYYGGGLGAEVKF